MKTKHKNGERVIIEVSVAIPNRNGKGVAERVPVKVEAVYDARDDDYVLDGTALHKLDTVKARYMGILMPSEIKDLRTGLGLTQIQMCEFLEIGHKTYSRWETGKGRPSRVLNLLLRSLRDGKIDMGYLERAGEELVDWQAIGNRTFGASRLVGPLSKEYDEVITAAA